MSDTVEIPLANGKGVAVIDRVDQEIVGAHRWYLHEVKGARYARSGTGGYMHRLVAGLVRGDGLEVDHRDGDGLRNVRENLRVCTHAQNQQNRNRQARRRSKHRGVTWVALRGNWMARCTIGGRSYFGGYFADEDEAGRAAAALRAEHMPYANA